MLLFSLFFLFLFASPTQIALGFLPLPSSNARTNQFTNSLRKESVSSVHSKQLSSIFRQSECLSGRSYTFVSEILAKYHLFHHQRTTSVYRHMTERKTPEVEDVTSSEYKINVLQSINEISEDEWNQCAMDACGKGKENPFVLWGFFKALEDSKSASAEVGWAPQHLAVRCREQSRDEHGLRGDLEI